MTPIHTKMGLSILEVKFMFRIVVSLAFILSFTLIRPFLASAQERVRVGWAAMTASHTPLSGGAGKRIFSEARFIG